MRAGELCNREVVIIEPEETVIAAALLMRNHHVGDVVVVRREPVGNVPVAVLTDRDLVVEVLALVVDRAPQLLVADLIGRDLLCVGEACELDEVLRLMRERGIRRVPVVDTAGALVGIITFDDIVDILAEQLSGLATLVKRQIRHEAQRRV